MHLIFYIIFLFLTLISVVLYVSNIQLKKSHKLKMKKLKQVIYSLHDKQKKLNEKVIINSDFNASYSKDMKAIGDEVVELQRVFLEMISEKK